MPEGLVDLLKKVMGKVGICPECYSISKKCEETGRSGEIKHQAVFPHSGCFSTINVHYKESCTGCGYVFREITEEELV